MFGLGVFFSFDGFVLFSLKGFFSLHWLICCLFSFCGLTGLVLILGLSLLFVCIVRWFGFVPIVSIGVYFMFVVFCWCFRFWLWI